MIFDPIFIITALIGYLLGSIPFGLILTRLSGLGDIRQIGSGNIGATNVLRTGNKKLALLTLLLDALKGTIAVLIGGLWGPSFALCAGFAAFIGHLFPVWLKFKGGKGVATYIGVLIGISWLGALIFGLCWILCAYITRYSSLSALISAIVTPIALYVLTTSEIALIIAVMSIILIARHHENIGRLLNGTESKIGSKG